MIKVIVIIVFIRREHHHLHLTFISVPDTFAMAMS